MSQGKAAPEDCWTQAGRSMGILRNQEDQRGWRTVDADVADNEGERRKQRQDHIQPAWTGLIYLEQFLQL